MIKFETKIVALVSGLVITVVLRQNFTLLIISSLESVVAGIISMSNSKSCSQSSAC